MGMRNDSFRAVFQGANLISRKQVDAGIRLLESIRDGDPDREIVGLKHVQLAIAYGRKKLIDRSDHHWHKAIEYDHFTGIAYEKLAISLTREPFAKFARKRDLLSGRVVVPGKPMASQVQIPFEGVILQEHSAPISCPTPNFAKGSRLRKIGRGY